MKGGFIVLLWLFCFSTVSYLSCYCLKLSSTLLRTIFTWNLLMCFVALFEAMLIFKHNYVSEKGEHYYNTNTCYWSEHNSIMDAFSTKMYMDLYADYSFCDKRYSNPLYTDNGCRFVVLGEIIHGAFCFFLCPFILYFFSKGDNRSVYLSALVLSAIQFALIVWYLATVFLEMAFVKNDKFWFPPILWNVPWVFVPLYIMYGVAKTI